MTAQPDDDMPDDPRLGDLIREQMRHRRLRLEDLAGELGVHRSTLSRWISGEVAPSPPHLADLEHALGVRFIDDGAGRYAALDAAPPPDPAPRVVVLVAGTAEAMDAALDRLGVPRVE